MTFKEAMDLLYLLALVIIVTIIMHLTTGCSHQAAIPECEFDGSCGLEGPPEADLIPDHELTDDPLPDQVLRSQWLPPKRKHRKKK